MSATDEMGVSGEAAPLTDAMLTMDVVDTLKASPGLAEAADAAAQLRALYARLGIELGDTAAAQGIEAFRTGSFDYVPARGPAAALARLYAGRRHWAPGALAAIVFVALGLGGYFFLYQPYQESRATQAQLELKTALPAADGWAVPDHLRRDQGAAGGQRARRRCATRARRQRSAATAPAPRRRSPALPQIRDTLSVGYTLRIVDRPDVKWGFWTFPEDNAEATNYFLVVEARDAGGNPVNVPITDMQSGRTERVSMWALRVPEEIYRTVEADKTDNGRISRDLVGAKDIGFLDPDYTVDVLGGALTRW